MRRWFETHTFHAAGQAADLTVTRGKPRVGVVLPARNEEATVGAIVTAIRSLLMDLVPVVHDVVVVDSASTDQTAEAARAAGARVVPADPGTGDDLDGDDFDGGDFDGGKGAALRSGTAALDTELVVFLDADVPDFDPAFVTGLVAPLLRDRSLVLAKAFYDRPTRGGGGGRVTELTARPEISARAPELAGFVQPLAGECAFVREAMLDQPFASGYAVDLAMLLQTVRRHGLGAVAQVDLGHREHEHQGLEALGRMAVEVRAAFDLVLDGHERVVTERLVPRRDATGRVELVAERIESRLLPPIVAPS